MRPGALGLAAALALSALLPARLSAVYPLDWPPLRELIASGFELQDVGFLAAGFRRLAADAAWVQLLLYLGSAMPEDEHEGERGSGAYPQLRDLTLRVNRLDPYFTQPYVFGATVLAWYPNTERYDEAIEILREGLRRNPEHWPFYAMLAAIGYRQHGQFGRMQEELERAVRHPGCPTLVRSILANSYKAQGRHAGALRHWLIILDDPRASDYHERARREIAWLSALNPSPSR